MDCCRCERCRHQVAGSGEMTSIHICMMSHLRMRSPPRPSESAAFNMWVRKHSSRADMNRSVGGRYGRYLHTACIGCHLYEVLDRLQALAHTDQPPTRLWFPAPQMSFRSSRQWSDWDERRRRPQHPPRVLNLPLGWSRSGAEPRLHRTSAEAYRPSSDAHLEASRRGPLCAQR